MAFRLSALNSSQVHNKLCDVDQCPVKLRASKIFYELHRSDLERFLFAVRRFSRKMLFEIFIIVTGNCEYLRTQKISTTRKKFTQYLGNNFVIYGGKTLMARELLMHP